MPIAKSSKRRVSISPVFISRSRNSETSLLVEIIEIKDHPYFLATQAHPEFKSSAVAPIHSSKASISAAWKVRIAALNKPEGIRGAAIYSFVVHLPDERLTEGEMGLSGPSRFTTFHLGIRRLNRLQRLLWRYQFSPN